MCHICKSTNQMNGKCKARIKSIFLRAFDGTDYALFCVVVLQNHIQFTFKLGVKCDNQMNDHNNGKTYYGCMHIFCGWFRIIILWFSEGGTTTATLYLISLKCQMSMSKNQSILTNLLLGLFHWPKFANLPTNVTDV